MKNLRTNSTGVKSNIDWSTIDCPIDQDQLDENIRKLLRRKATIHEPIYLVGQQIRGKPLMCDELERDGIKGDARHTLPDIELEAAIVVLLMLCEKRRDGSYRYFPDEFDKDGNRSLSPELIFQVFCKSPYADPWTLQFDRNISNKLRILEREGIIKRRYRKHLTDNGGYVTRVYGHIRSDRIWLLTQNRRGHIEFSRKFWKNLEKSNHQKTNSND